MFGNLFGTRKYIVDNQVQQGQQVPSQVFTPQNPVISQPPVVGAPSPMEPSIRQRTFCFISFRYKSCSNFKRCPAGGKRIKQALIEPEQLMIGLLYDGEVFKLISQFSSDPTKIAREIQGRQTMGAFAGEPTLSDATKKSLMMLTQW